MEKSRIIAYSILPTWNSFNTSFNLSTFSCLMDAGWVIQDIDDSLLDLRRLDRFRCSVAHCCIASSSQCIMRQYQQSADKMYRLILSPFSSGVNTVHVASRE